MRRLLAEVAVLIPLLSCAGWSASPVEERGKTLDVVILQSPAGLPGIPEETPNQRRRRLGQPITESFPPLEYGVLAETPNQRHKRLGETIVASFPEMEYGKREETPNERRKRQVRQAVGPLASDPDLPQDETESTVAQAIRPAH